MHLGLPHSHTEMTEAEVLQDDNSDTIDATI